MILESKHIRKILFSKSTNLSIANPIPSIIFIITAISISSHDQLTEFSSGIHKQFGGFLLLGGLFRLFTIIILYFTNINYDDLNLKSSITIHPPTEFISSFCWISCGITLMIANKSLSFLLDNVYNFD